MAVIELAKIADIIPPALPASPTSHAEFYVGSALILIAVFSWLFLSRSSGGRLRRLRRLHQRQGICNRQLAFKLSQLLCQRHSLSRFSPTIAPDQRDKNQWRNFAANLQTACYRRNISDDKTLLQLLEQTHHWLKVKP